MWAAVVKEVAGRPPAGQCGIGLLGPRSVCKRHTKNDCSRPCEPVVLCPWMIFMMMLVMIIINSIKQYIE